MNKFYEQFITKDYGTLPNAINIISKILLVMGVLSLITFGLFGIIFAIPFFVCFVLVELYVSNKFIEFEYEYYDKEITISKVINKKKRKELACINVSNIIKVDNFNNISKNDKIIKCTINGLNLKEVVIFVNDKNGNKIGYLMGLDEKILSILKKDNQALFNHI